MRRRLSFRRTPGTCSRIVTIVSSPDNDGRKKAAVDNLMAHVFTRMKSGPLSVHLFEERRPDGIVDEDGPLTNQSGEERPPGALFLAKTILYVWNKNDILNWKQLSGQIQVELRFNQKNVVVVLLDTVPVTELAVSFLSLMKYVRFLLYIPSNAKFSSKLNAMVMTSHKTSKKAWRYENAIKRSAEESDIVSDSYRYATSVTSPDILEGPLGSSSSHGSISSAISAPTSSVDDSDASQNEVRSLSSLLYDLQKSFSDNNDLLHQVLAQRDDHASSDCSGVGEEIKELEHELRQMFDKVSGRIRGNRRRFLRCLLKSDQVIEEIEDSYGDGFRRSVSDEVIYKALCTWASESDMSSNEIHRQLNRALHDCGHPADEMSKVHKIIINANRIELAENIADMEAVCMFLQTDNIITERHKQMVLGKDNTQRKVDELIDILSTRGVNAFGSFLGALAHEGNEYIAQKLVDEDKHATPLEQSDVNQRALFSHRDKPLCTQV